MDINMYYINGMKLSRPTILVLLISTFILLACAHNNKPSGPVIYYDGKLSISNKGEVPITIVEMTQKRGTKEVRLEMGNSLHPGFSYALHNIIDRDGGLVFPGGDKVTVKFASQEYNSIDPYFQDTVQLTVNGNIMVQIKYDGRYTVNPQ
jgi:hypothetical protein